MVGVFQEQEMKDATAERINIATIATAEPRWVPVLQLLWKGRGLLLKWTAAGLLVSIILAFAIPKRYTSSVSLMPPDSSLMNLGLMAAMTGITPSSAGAGLASNLLSGRTQGETFIGIVESRTAQDDLINEFDLRKVYYLRTYRDARKKLSERTYASEDRKSGIITISVTDNDKYRARDLARAYVEELNKLVVLMDTSSAHRERVFLGERLDAVKQTLDSVSLQLSQFSSRNATLDVQDQGMATLQATARLQGELIAAQSGLQGLKAIYSDQNIRVREAQARVQELQADLTKMGGTKGEVTGDLGGGETLPSLRQIPMLGYTYLDLYRQAKIQETLYETLTKQYELAKLEEAKEIPTVKVLDPAQLPEKKSFPSRVLMIILGVFFGAILGSAVVLTRQWWSNLSADDPRKILVLDILVSLQRGTSWRERLGLGRKRHRVTAGN